MPNATLSIPEFGLSQSSTNFGIRLGGRLSTQKKPISSKNLSTVLFPAPDIPVTIIKRIGFPPFLLTYNSNLRL